MTPALKKIALFAVKWARSYAVAITLLLLLTWVFVQAFFLSVGPIPQHPPRGYTAYRDALVLQWEAGSRKEPIKLQIAPNDPLFQNMTVDKVVNRDSYPVRDLIPGATYYWRLVQDGKTSRVHSFKVAKTSVRY